MMDLKLIKALEPLEERFECDLFTFDEALEFYKADIKSYEILIDQLIKTAQEGTANPEFLKGIEAGLRQSLWAVNIIFGGRIEEGF